MGKKKLGARWVPGQPFLVNPKVSHALAHKSALGGEEIELPMAQNGMALVLVLAQDPNVKVEKTRGECET